MLDKDTVVSMEDRGRIIQGVMRLVEDGRVKNVNARTIGDSIGVKSEKILRVFPDLSLLWRSLLIWIEDRLMALLEHSAGNGRDVVEALENMFKCHTSFIFHHLGMIRIVMNSLHVGDARFKREILRIRTHYETDVAAMICLGKTEGVIRNEVDAQAAAAYYIALVQGMAVRMSMVSSHDRAEVLEDAQGIFRIYLDGIRVRSINGLP